MGGLGNQMFQYAFGYSLAHSLNVRVNFDDRYYKYNDKRVIGLSNFKLSKLSFGKFIIPLWFLNLFIFRPYLGRVLGLYLEKNISYDHNIFSENRYQYYCGYFQCEKYFSDFRAELLKEFKPIMELNEANKGIESEIKKSVSISLHVRRGDYLTDTLANEVNGTCNIGYYLKSIEMMQNYFPKCRFFIFSDEIDWVKDNIKIPGNPIFIDNNKITPVIDIYLMSLCDHNIIANSTFSWWGAWLNQNADKIVIAPKQWFKNMNTASDLIPNSWIVV